MPELLLLVSDPGRARNDNHLRLPRAFERCGWAVTVADHESVRMKANRLRIADHDPNEFELIWLLGFGQQTTFLDRMQLLDQLPEERFVTTPRALVFLHGKHRWLEWMPETYTDRDPAALTRVLTSGGDWIVKPSAGSYGRDVALFRAGTATLQALEAISARNGGGYLLAQRYLPEIAGGEIRTLLAGGRIIGSYLRVPESDHRANLAAGARAEPVVLSKSQRQLVTHVGAEALALGAGFVAVDTVGEHLMEVNVANPGGLATLANLHTTEPETEVVRAILDWKKLPAHRPA